jgi:hypothetical protein
MLAVDEEVGVGGGGGSLLHGIPCELHQGKDGCPEGEGSKGGPHRVTDGTEGCAFGAARSIGGREVPDEKLN